MPERHDPDHGHDDISLLAQAVIAVMWLLIILAVGVGAAITLST